MACGRRPGWGYVDHPPLVGWVAWLVAQRRRGVAPRAARGGGARDGGDRLARRPDRRGARRRALRPRPRRPRHRPRPGRPLPRQLLLDERLRPPLLGAHRLDPRARALGRPRAALARLRRGRRPRPPQQDQHPLPRLRPRRRASSSPAGGTSSGRASSGRAALLAFAIFLPHLLWQHANGWPTLEFMANARRDKMAPLSPPGFVEGGAPPDGAHGLALGRWAWRGSSSPEPPRRVRALGFAFLVVVGVLAFGGGKPYYLAAAYSLAFAAGAVAVEAWTAGRARVLRPVLAVLMVGVALARLAARAARPARGDVRALRRRARPEARHRGAPGARPPPAVLRRHARLARDGGGGGGRRPHACRAEDRAKACVFGQNYGEAGAIEYFARDLDLPPAISGHNSYWLWGPGRLHGRGARRHRRPARAARRAVRRRAPRRRLALHGLHALRGRPLDLGRPRPRSCRSPSVWPSLKGFI